MTFTSVTSPFAFVFTPTDLVLSQDALVPPRNASMLPSRHSLIPTGTFRRLDWQASVLSSWTLKVRTISFLSLFCQPRACSTVAPPNIQRHPADAFAFVVSSTVHEK